MRLFAFPVPCKADSIGKAYFMATPKSNGMREPLFEITKIPNATAQRTTAAARDALIEQCHSNATTISATSALGSVKIDLYRRDEAIRRSGLKYFRQKTVASASVLPEFSKISDSSTATSPKLVAQGLESSDATLEDAQSKSVTRKRKRSLG